MDFLKTGLKSVLGAPAPSVPPSVAETIERLLERVETSTLLEDRRDACRALKSLSKPYRVEVGAQGLEILIGELRMDQSDNETLSYTLDSLCSIITGTHDDPFDPASPGVSTADDDQEDVGKSFTEIFVKKKENVALLLDILKEFDFKVRWPALKLLMGLLKHKIRDLQDAILAHPTGVSQLMDLLSDSREIIRNDAILLLMLLTKGNANIQKIVAFENAFDRIFEIMVDEGFTDGGVVVEDCLIVLQNLLKNNTSNQNFFKEGSYIQRLQPFLDIPEEVDWSNQKTSNTLFFLQVIRSLVSPTNPAHVTASSQKVMATCGILEQLCNLLLASGIPPELTTEAINTVAEVIRGDHHNQEYFSKVNAPTNPPKSIVSIILLSMVGEKQAFDLRCAVLYCFECYLYRNELSQAQIVETLLPNSVMDTSSNSVTSGQLLVGGLYSADCLTNWLVSVALSHTMVDNKTQKEQLLRVQIVTESSSQPMGLMAQICSMMHQGVKFQKRIGLLTLLATWLSHCPLAVSNFLNIPTNVPYLTSQVSLIEGDETELLIQGICAFILGICIQFNDDSVQSFTKEDLLSLITKRAGLDTFLNKLSSISKSSHYSSAVQKPQIKSRKADDLVFDHEFCNLFKSLEHVIANTVQAKPNELTNGSSSPSEDINQYKDLIRVQDLELQQLRRDLSIYSQQNSYLQQQIDQLNMTVQQIRGNQIATFHPSQVYPLGSVVDESSNSAVDQLKHKNEELNSQVSQLCDQLEKWKLYSQQQQEAFESSYQQQQQYYQQQLESNHVSLNGQNTVLQDHERQELEQLRAESIWYRSEVERLSSEISKKTSELPAAITNGDSSPSLLAEVEALRKQQEDLMIILSDQDNQIKEYKKQLKALGAAIPDDDELGPVSSPI